MRQPPDSVLALGARAREARCNRCCRGRTLACWLSKPSSSSKTAAWQCNSAWRPDSKLCPLSEGLCPLPKGLVPLVGKPSPSVCRRLLSNACSACVRYAARGSPPAGAGLRCRKRDHHRGRPVPCLEEPCPPGVPPRAPLRWHYRRRLNTPSGVPSCGGPSPSLALSSSSLVPPPDPKLARSASDSLVVSISTGGPPSESSESTSVS